MATLEWWKVSDRLARGMAFLLARHCNATPASTIGGRHLLGGLGILELGGAFLDEGGEAFFSVLGGACCSGG